MTVYQNHHGADLTELWNIDYSYKAIKTILSYESNLMKSCQLNLVAPCQYGAMPDLGRYSQPDGPVPNWSELMPLGKIAEARAAQEEAAEHATRDMVFVADAMAEAGADGMDFDTAGAAGDGDFLATLRAVEEIRRRYPDMSIEVGMASEFVLGMHGELEYQGHAARRHVAARPGQGRRPRPAPPSSARRSTSTRASRSPGTWPAPSRSSRSAARSRRSPST